MDLMDEFERASWFLIRIREVAEYVSKSRMYKYDDELSMEIVERLIRPLFEESENVYAYQDEVLDAEVGDDYYLLLELYGKKKRGKYTLKVASAEMFRDLWRYWSGLYLVHEGRHRYCRGVVHFQIERGEKCIEKLFLYCILFAMYLNPRTAVGKSAHANATRYVSNNPDGMSVFLVGSDNSELLICPGKNIKRLLVDSGFELCRRNRTP